MPRQLNSAFTAANFSTVRHPGFVVKVEFSVGSRYLTSFPSTSGSGFPAGVVLWDIVQDISAISQQVFPEEGRSTIGGVTVKMLEASGDSVATWLNQNLDNNFEGIRDQKVEIWVGFPVEGVYDFDLLERIHVATADNLSLQNGLWTLKCRDQTKALREKVFEPKSTRLAADMTDSDTTLTVLSTAGFSTVEHDANWAVDPSATVGYLLIEDTGEIISYTGTTSTTFTGCTRGAFNTKPQAQEVDLTAANDTWPEITEFIYLDRPGPQAAIAVLTGVLDTQASPRPTTPAHWHLGLDYDTDFNTTEWENIGNDIWEADDLGVGIETFFHYLEEEDGKAFVEEEIMRLIGCYMRVDRNGKIGLRRVNRVIKEAGWLGNLDDGLITSHGALTYDQTAVINQFEIRWDYDGEDFRRALLIQDNDSISKHGAAPRKTLSFRGLHTTRHTDRRIQELIGTLRDRYAEPPLRLSLSVVPWPIWNEIGDTVNVKIDQLSDYYNDETLDRPFEIQRERVNWAKGTIDYDLFGSARNVESLPGNDDSTAPLADSFYTATGTDIATLPNYTAAAGGNPATLDGSHNLAGGNPTTTSAAVYYHDGDLDILQTCTITINKNICFRIKGFLTVDGDIDGAGNGHTGGVDAGSTGGNSDGWSTAGTAGYLGTAVAGAGIHWFQDSPSFNWLGHINGSLTVGQHPSSVPFLDLNLNAAGTSLAGIRHDLRGTSGGSGGQLIKEFSMTNWRTDAETETGSTFLGAGGDGGASGAGLMVICRGMAMGPNGSIDLSGDDGQEGDLDNVGTFDVYDTTWAPVTDWELRGGHGAGGYPGSLHVLLDGDGLIYPNFNANNLICNRGTSIPANAISAADISDGDGRNLKRPALRWPENTGDGDAFSPRGQLTGFNPDDQAGANIWAAAHRTQYIPAPPDAVENRIPAPAGLTATGGPGAISLAWTWAGPQTVDVVEVFATDDAISPPDRANAVEVGEVAANNFQHVLSNGGTRYYWIRARRGGRVSEWHPSGATSGVSATAAKIENFFTFNNFTRTWTVDRTTSPKTFDPAASSTQIVATLIRAGLTIGQEIIDVTRVDEQITASYDTNHAGITSSWTATPANTIQFTFTDPVTSHSEDVTITVTNAGGAPIGAPGYPGGTFGFDINAGIFGGSNPGEIYVHGFTEDGAAADVDGKVLFNGVELTLKKGALHTNLVNEVGGWILADTAFPSPPTFTVGGFAYNYAAARKIRQFGVEKWQYDNDGTWQDISIGATSTIVVIGSYTSSTADLIDTAHPTTFALSPSSVPAYNMPAMLSASINKSTFTTTNNAHIYLHGQDETGATANVDGEILKGDGNWVAIAKGSVAGLADGAGWIMYDSDEPSPAFWAGAAGSNDHLALVRKVRVDAAVQWQYDLVGTWTNFTPTGGMVIVGSYKRDNSLSPDAFVQAEMFPMSPLRPEDIPFQSSTETGIQGDDIVAATILTGNLMVAASRFGALNEDPEFTDTGINSTVAHANRRPWGIDNGTGGSGKIDIATGQSSAPIGDRGLRFGASSDDDSRVETNRLIPYDTNRKYRVSAIARYQSSSDYEGRLYIKFYDYALNLITATTGSSGWTSSGSGRFYWYEADPFGDGTGVVQNKVFGQSGGDCVPPNGAKFFRLGVHAMVAGTGSTKGIQDVYSYRAEEAVDSTRIEPDIIIGTNAKFKGTVEAGRIAGHADEALSVNSTDGQTCAFAHMQLTASGGPGPTNIEVTGTGKTTLHTITVYHPSYVPSPVTDLRTLRLQEENQPFGYQGILDVKNTSGGSRDLDIYHRHRYDEASPWSAWTAIHAGRTLPAGDTGIIVIGTRFRPTNTAWTTKLEVEIGVAAATGSLGDCVHYQFLRQLYLENLGELGGGGTTLA